MQYLYLPPSVRHFDALPREAGAPRAAPVEYDLAQALRPRIVVDLGTGDASGFFSICQSLRDHDIDGIAYGVDTWSDDGPDDTAAPFSRASVNNLMHAHFRGTAYLPRISVEDIRAHFEPGSVDLLRFDATRLGRPVASVLSDWAPKVAPGGVLLGVGLSSADSLSEWRQVEQDRGVFVAGEPALGFVRTLGGPSPGKDDFLLGTLTQGDRQERDALGAFYGHVIRHHELRALVRDVPALFRKKA